MFSGLRTLPALAAYLLIVFLIKPLRQSVDWLRRGSLTQNTIWRIIAVIAVSTAILVIWYLLSRPDVDAIAQLLPSSNAVIIVAAVFGFAIVNAIVEEFIFDGVCYHAFETVIAIPLVVILLQAFCTPLSPMSLLTSRLVCWCSSHDCWCVYGTARRVNFETDN